MPITVMLPAPAGNGAGPWVDTSALANKKTLTVGGKTWASVNLEISNETIPQGGATVGETFRQTGRTAEQVVKVAALWMRARVSGYHYGGAPVVQVAAEPSGGGADGVTITAAAPNGSGVVLVAGTPVAIWDNGQFRLARADSVAYSHVQGLVSADTAPTLSTTAVTYGLLELAASQWDAVTGQVGGLSVGANYYLDVAPGKLTTTPPSLVGQTVAAVGTALAATIMLVRRLGTITL